MNTPSKDDCTYVRRFAVADEDANYVGGSARYDVHLGEGQLWLSSKLSIPIPAIRAKELIERGRLPKRSALRIVFDHPQTGVRDAVHLCDIDAIGFYHRRNLDALSKAIDQAVAATVGAETPSAIAELPPVAKRQSFWLALSVGTFRPLLAPERAILDYYRSWAERWKIADDSWTSVEQVQLALMDHAAGTDTDTPIREVFRLEQVHVKLQQANAIWNLFWLVLLPFWILGRWAITSGAQPSVGTLLGLAFGYFLAMGVCALIQGLLYKEFLSFLSRWLGHEIIHHSRKYW